MFTLTCELINFNRAELKMSNTSNNVQTSDFTGNKAAKYLVATVTNDEKNSTLVVDAFARVMREYYDHGEVTFILIGCSEISDERKDEEITHHHVVCHWHSPVGISKIKEVWDKMDIRVLTEDGGIKWFVQRGTNEQACKYALKSGAAPYLSLGKLRDKRGNRTLTDDKKEMFSEFKNDVVSGNVTTYEECLEEHSIMCAEANNFVHEYLDLHVNRLPCLPANYKLRVWQWELIEHCLQLDPDDRHIVFVVDKEGNSGKSWLCRYLHALLPHKICQILRPEKNKDMALMLDPMADCILLDVPREVTMDTDKKILQYRLLEEIKDGYVSSSKYRSRKKYMKPCHVIVFMNHDPHPGALSEDRYIIYRITKDKREFHVRPNPHVPNSGPEFNGDMAGDGPTFDAAAFAALGKDGTNTNEPVRKRTYITRPSMPFYLNDVPYEGVYLLIPYTHVHRFFVDGNVYYGEESPVRVPRNHPFLIPVFAGDGRGLDDWCMKHLGWNGSGFVELIVNLKRWPTKRELINSQDLYDENVVPQPFTRYDLEGNRYWVQPPFNSWCYHRNGRGSTFEVGDNKMSFGTCHTLQVAAGNYEGNPNKGISASRLDDPKKWPEEFQPGSNTGNVEYQMFKHWFNEKVEPWMFIDGAYFYDMESQITDFIPIKKKT